LSLTPIELPELLLFARCRPLHQVRFRLDAVGLIPGSIRLWFLGILNLSVHPEHPKKLSDLCRAPLFIRGSFREPLARVLETISPALATFTSGRSANHSHFYLQLPTKPRFMLTAARLSFLRSHFHPPCALFAGLGFQSLIRVPSDSLLIG
jgi:hypothetical protein